MAVPAHPTGPPAERHRAAPRPPGSAAAAVPAGAAVEPPDGSVLAAVTSAVASDPLTGGPVDTIDEVVERQRAIQHHLLHHRPRRGLDGLACFNFLYRIITEDVRDRVRAGGFFDDERFLLDLDVAFANRYFDALRADALGRPAPLAWQALLAARDRRRVAAIRFAIAGVNAHVNYDLPFALLTTVEGLDRPLDHGSHRADYERINHIFAVHMCGLRQHFLSHEQRRVDDLLFARAADLAGDRLVDWARDVAWANAERLWEHRGDPVYLAESDRRIDAMVGRLGRALVASLPV